MKFASLAAAIGIGSVFAQVDFSHTITLGSILLGIVIAAAAGLITIRSKVATVWQQEANGYREQAQRIGEELLAEKSSRAKFEREQQELRHALKDELAAVKAALKVEEAKHDLSTILERMQGLHSEAMAALTSAQSAAVDSVTLALQELGRKLEEGQAEQKVLLRDIRDAVKAHEETA